VRRVLQTLPKDLNETYDRVLQNIPQTRVHNAIKLLQLLVFSQRSLSLEEVTDAIATEPDAKPPFTSENRIDPARAVVGYCPSFVRITITHGGDYEASSITIHLAHFSVQEYLLLSRKENPYYKSFAKRVANTAIAQIFLAYLCTAAEAQQSVSTFPLNHYAAKHWLYHAKTAGDGEETTFTWICELLTNDHIIRYWRHICDWPSRSAPKPALYYASQGGLCRSVRHLLKTGAKISGRTGKVLQAACLSGSSETVQALIDHGAHLHARPEDRSALQVAVITGNVEISRMLLENGANANAINEGTTALHHASRMGHVEIVSMLLEYGADVNIIGVHGSALQRAALAGSRCAKIVRMLLDHGADFNLQTPESRPVLSIACMSGHMGTVRMLLDQGVNVNAEGAWYGTAICAAAHCGHREVVQMLLDRGADVNARNSYYGHALKAACHPK